MLVFLARRLAFFVLALFVSSILIFSLIRLAGGNVAAVMLGKAASPQAIDELMAELGLDRPLPVQYLDWITGMSRVIWALPFVPVSRSPTCSSPGCR